METNELIAMIAAKDAEIADLKKKHEEVVATHVKSMEDLYMVLNKYYNECDKLRKVTETFIKDLEL